MYTHKAKGKIIKIRGVPARKKKKGLSKSGRVMKNVVWVIHVLIVKYN